MLQAIREFLAAKDWRAARLVVETRQEQLFRPEMLDIFQQYIAHAREIGEEQQAGLLETHLAVLLACQQYGIEPTFSMLQAQSEEPDWPFDSNVITSSITALLGGPQEKVAWFQHFMPLATQTTDVQLRSLLEVIQQALVGAERSSLGQDLDGFYRRAWEATLTGLETSQ